MTIEEIKARIEQLEKAIFMEQMADFMNWNNYHKWTVELNQLKRQLKEMRA